MEIKFYKSIDDKILNFAVIIAIYHGKYVLCKHKERETFEFPGGHREDNESIIDTAKRELYEETGATSFEIIEVCPYSVKGKDGQIVTTKETFGMLYYAEIFELKEINSEIEKIEFFLDIPYDKLTYPMIHTSLYNRYINIIKNGRWNLPFFYENKFL